MNSSSASARKACDLAAQKLAIGKKAEVHVPGVEQPVEATVSFIGPALDPGSTTVEVWLKLANSDGHLKVGTAVHAVLSGTTVQNALQVPSNAIVPGNESGPAVMVAGADGTAHRRSVTLGIRTPQSVQILSGLAPTDSVITEGGYGLDDGTKIQVGRPGVNDENPADTAVDRDKR